MAMRLIAYSMSRSEREMMRTAFALAAKAVFNVWYRLCCLVPRRNEVLFCSRQANEPSYNFQSIGDECERRGWKVSYLTKRLSKRAVVSFAGHVVREIYHLARCRVCVLDRYDPVVGLLDFDCEPLELETAHPAEEAMHAEFPRHPMVVQLWHAFGAFKKFGFQSLDTPEGHPTSTAESYGIHRNYSWIVCTGEQNRAAFAEAFSYPAERIVPFGLPEYDDLLAKRQKAEAGNSSVTRVLFAPTLRKDDGSPHPFRDLEEAWDDSLVGEGVEVVWSFHPLEAGGGASLSVSEALLEADYVITDYSSIVYEAYVLGKRVAFYVPDIDDYRRSPGLNSDPVALAPRLAFDDPGKLMRFIEELVQGRISYPQEDLERFVGTTFDQSSSGISKRIVDFIEDRLTEME